MKGTDNNRVLVVRCDRYDPDTIQRHVSEGMERLGYLPVGKIFVKPNVVFAGDPDTFGVHAFTNTGLVGAVLRAMGNSRDVERIDMGENSGIGFPTRYCLKNAGYFDEVKRVRADVPCPVGIYCIDEDRREEVFVGGKVHDTLRLSQKMVRADSMVYLPKLKCHCVSTITGAVKLNIGICSDDERAIRHDFLLNDKIVDLLAVGWPDFIVMDAIEVGVGNEAFPIPRKLGLLLLGTNPIAVDLVGARLLGYEPDDVPYLKRAIERGYAPTTLNEVALEGDLTSIAELDAHAQRILPRDREYTAWQDINAELERLSSPIRFFLGPYKDESDDVCLTGCVMGLKMFLAGFEQYAGAEAFKKAKPVVFVIGHCEEPIDARGEEAILIGSCTRADVRNASKITHIEKCFTTASDLTFAFSQRLGMPTPMRDIRFTTSLLSQVARASANKLVRRRYTQDLSHFVKKSLIRKV